MIDFKTIIGIDDSQEEMSWRKTTDKNGRFFHLTQRAANRDFIFDKEVGQYRHNILCRICARLNVKIIFSVTMSNHTHDVLVSDDVKNISKAVRLVNAAVSRKLRKKYPTKYKNGRKVFEARPYFRTIKSIVDLTVVGKYVFDNAKGILDKGEFVPYDCFWMFEKGMVSRPYDKKIYPLLFGMTEKELCAFFKNNDSKAVCRIANERFRSWTKEDNDKLFKKDASKPWIEEASCQPT